MTAAAGDQEVYVLDSSVPITAYTGYYSFEICPGFWEFLIYLSTASRVISIDKVRDELTNNRDIAAWIGRAPHDFIRSTNEVAVQSEYAALMLWAQQLSIPPAKKAEFASVADAWLVAYAKAHGMTVVTQEVAQRSKGNSIKIPDVCAAHGVSCIHTFEMLRRTGAKFTWAP